TLDHQRARQLLADALQAAQKLGMNQLYDEVVAAQTGLLPAPLVTESQLGSLPEDILGAAVFRLDGEYWTIAFEQTIIRLKDTKGLRYLRSLLAAPGREFHVLDLATGTTSSADPPAKRARSNVTKSLRACLKRIETAHPALGAHLATTVTMGYLCSYRPDPHVPAEWRT
ncbi:MAG: hypothetical protein WAK86_08695, partial [Pseudonocardiaceae bacterium]